MPIKAIHSVYIIRPQACHSSIRSYQSMPSLPSASSFFGVLLLGKVNEDLLQGGLRHTVLQDVGTGLHLLQSGEGGRQVHTMVHLKHNKKT